MRLPMRWTVVLVAMALIAASCGGDDLVRTERIDAIDTNPSVVTTPQTTPLPQTTPQTTTTVTESAEVAPSSTPAPRDQRAADTGLDDELFPALGSPDVDVISYDVRLDVNVSAGSFAAVVGVVADVVADVGQLALDADGFTVDAVTLDGVETSFEQVDAELLIDLPPDRAERVEAEITYTAAPDGDLSSVGIPAGWFHTANGSYVLNEPDGGHTWMPSNDHPSDKATWRFEITVPDDVIAVANGENIQRGGSGTPWIWEMNEPMSTYLVLLVIGDYTIVEGTDVTSISGGTIPLTNLAPSDRVEEMQVFFDQTAAQIAFFETLFGPYPLDGYGLAFIDSVPGLAMETQGRSFFSMSDFAGGNLGYLAHLLQAHELAHQWFGNAVSPATWSDIWLNESFATYSQWLWLEEVGLVNLTTQIEDSLRVRQNGRVSTGDPDIASLFGFESYDGGAVIVHALRLTIGDSAFFELLQRWVADNDGTSQTTDAFIALADEISGQNLTQFFDDWLYSIDLPGALPG